MVKHSVIFTFKQSIDKKDKQLFLDASAKLADIPGVKNLQVLKQVSTKNDFEYGIAMEFDTNEIYQQYNSHPQHQQFIEQYWMKCVDRFLEIDFEELVRD